MLINKQNKNVVASEANKVLSTSVDLRSVNDISDIDDNGIDSPWRKLWGAWVCLTILRHGEEQETSK